jgi:acetylornithine/succinyldiaminopimelate/putrescine aminotransferase
VREGARQRPPGRRHRRAHRRRRHVQPGDHGSTFAGGPVLCAAGLATIGALVATDLGGNAERMGVYLRQELERLGEETGVVSEVRGAGLMNAVEFTEPIAQQVAASGLEQGLVLNAVGTHILRFLPPLVCGKSDIDTLLATLHAILNGPVGH